MYNKQLSRYKIQHFSFALISFLLSTTVNADSIKSFTSDGCSIFPDGTFNIKNYGYPVVPLTIMLTGKGVHTRKD